MSHDGINRYLAQDKLTPALVWEHVQTEVIPSKQGYIIFDDTVVDKTSSKAIAIAHWQYSGNAGNVIQGIGVVTCVFTILNAIATGRWIIASMHLIKRV